MQVHNLQKSLQKVLFFRTFGHFGRNYSPLEEWTLHFFAGSCMIKLFKKM